MAVTQQKIADRLGASQSFVSEVFGDKKKFSIPNAKKAAQLLDLAWWEVIEMPGVELEKLFHAALDQSSNN